jgi:hypothetical protein
LIQSGNSDIQPASSSKGSKAKLISWASSKKVLLPSGETLKVPLPNGLDNKLHPPPGREGYLTKMAAQQSPLPEISKQLEASPHSFFEPPQSPGRWGYLAAQQSTSKDFFGFTTSIIDNLRKLKFRPRFAYF